MAPQMSKTAAAAAAVAGTAFVALPSQGHRSSAPSSALRGARGSSSAAFGSAPSIAVLGATAVAVAALRKKDSQAVKATALQAFENELGLWADFGFCLEFFRFPGYISPSSEIKFTDIPNGLAAATKVPAVGWFQYTVFCGICDLWLMHQVPTNPPGKLCTRLFGEETTNYEYGFLGLPGYLGGKAIADPEIKKKKLNAELANGRLAMMAIIGMFFQDGLTGSAWGDWANYTESPLRAFENEAFENELGVQAPLGYFDPLGLSKDGDVETFRRRRESELKNGRVAMFATIGYMVPEYFKFPGYLAPSSNLKFADVPNGIAAITKVPAEGWLQWVALCGCYEFCVNTPVDPADPGNYGKGKFGYGNMVLGITAEPMEDPEGRKRALNSELANGRLAMMAILGLWVQDGLFGTPYGLYTGSSAFETELGVQPPVGFWDPLGFTKTDDAASFRRRRYVELKHGRVAMFACLGYIVPEYYRWPGDLSPSLGLKFSDVPTGFAAFSKVPLSGWAQMVAFAGSVELFQYVDDPKRAWEGAPGDFENAGFLGECIAGTGGPFPEDFWDPAGITAKKSKEEILQLRAMELKHGRVAMLAVLGWFHVAAGYHIVGDYAVGEHLDNNPLVNLTQMPMGGIWQVVFTIMCLEWVTTYVCKPPAEKPWDILGWSDILIEDEKSIWNQFRKAENQELNNGRLAMMGITGLIAQDVLFGDFGEAAVLPCFGAAACKELFSPVGPAATTEPFLGAGFIYPPLAQPSRQLNRSDQTESGRRFEDSTSSSATSGKRGGAELSTELSTGAPGCHLGGLLVRSTDDHVGMQWNMARSKAVPLGPADALLCRRQWPCLKQLFEAMAAPASSNSLQFASLYVGDLHPEVSEATLYEAFSQAGTVASCRVCRDNVTRKSLGYGYVNFGSVQEAERALEMLNYMSIKGKPCRVMWSQRDPERRKNTASNVFVKGLDPTIDNKALHDTFSIFGNILSCKVSTDDNGKSKGYGFVHYEKEEAAKEAILKVNGMKIADSTVFVGPFIKREERDDTINETFTNLYVRNMPPSWDDAKVAEIFSDFGEVSSSVLLSLGSFRNEGEQNTDDGKRFALVNFKQPEAAKAAVEALHKKDMRSEMGTEKADEAPESEKKDEKVEKEEKEETTEKEDKEDGKEEETGDKEGETGKNEDRAVAVGSTR
eukprot:s2316_g11.t1